MDDATLPEELPAWASRTLSASIRSIAGAGESQKIEFKVSLPEQIRHLAREMAAFATSNFGTLFLGIADDGEVVGLPDCLSHDGRETLRQRVEGLCSAAIKPSVLPTVTFGLCEGRAVVAIEIPTGKAPIHYVDHVPYVRHGTSSRPATPDEVIALIKAWLEKDDQDTPDTVASRFLSALAHKLVEIEIHSAELEEDRRLNPWLDRIRSAFKWLAKYLREESLKVPELLSDLAGPLSNIADDLDRVAHERLTMGGGWDEMDAAMSAAITEINTVWEKWLPKKSFSADSLTFLQASVSATAKSLSSLADRVDEMDDQGRLDEIQISSGAIGWDLMKLATFGCHVGDENRFGQLRAIAQRLRGLETRTIYMDGGQSVRAVLDGVKGTRDDLSTWLAA